MTDPATLAREARRALAGAHTATLLIEGLGRVSPHPGHVLLDDQEGRPRFTCTADSSIATAAAARCPAILDIGVPTSSTLPVGSVIFAGHLAIGAPLAADGAAAQDILVVDLHLVSVLVEIDDPQSRSLVTRQVPLDLYAGSGLPTAPSTSLPGCPPVLAESAETMRVHTNARHAERLRACAAARAGVSDGEVIQARLVEVAADGAVLEWLDLDGGHVVRLGFPRAAGDGRELAALLRGQLCAHRDAR